MLLGVGSRANRKAASVVLVVAAVVGAAWVFGGCCWDMGMSDCLWASGWQMRGTALIALNNSSDSASVAPLALACAEDA